MQEPAILVRCVGIILACVGGFATSAGAQDAAVRIEVHSETTAIPGATVVVNGATLTTDAQGLVVLRVPPGTVEITAIKNGFAPLTTSVQDVAGQEQRVVIELSPQPTLEEEVIVVASTRTERRIEDQPLRVEVVPQEEIDEKVFMTPGDVSIRGSLKRPRPEAPAGIPGCSERRSSAISIVLVTYRFSTTATPFPPCSRRTTTRPSPG